MCSLDNNKGFKQPYLGIRPISQYAPIRSINNDNLNKSIGINKANYIAHKLGINKENCFTQKQYDLFITGNGVGGNKKNVEIIDRCIKILTNTDGRPLSYVDSEGNIVETILSSYGLFVNEEGYLMSLANTQSPCREVNSLIVPGGYCDTWCRNNGAENSLLELYKPTFFIQGYYGYSSQEISGTSQLVPYYNVDCYWNKPFSYIGMSMCPSIWIDNFWFLYVLNPTLASYMPAFWETIPEIIVYAINENDEGKVLYSEYKKFLK